MYTIGRWNLNSDDFLNLNLMRKSNGINYIEVRISENVNGYIPENQYIKMRSDDLKKVSLKKTNEHDVYDITFR